MLTVHWNKGAFIVDMFYLDDEDNLDETLMDITVKIAASPTSFMYIEATGEELYLILHRCKGIRVTSGVAFNRQDPIRWFGDDALFILGNWPKEDT